MRCLLFAVLAVGAVTVQPAFATDYEPKLDNLIETYIKPQTSAFAETAAKLPDAVRAVCANGDAASVETFETVYSETLRDFAHIHFLRFGPLIDNDRLSRLAFLPDPRGITQRQIRKVLASKDKDALSATTLKDKSVAVQGLTALELLAFDKDSAVRLGQAGNDKAFTCGYALAISENLAVMAGEIAEGWQDPDGYSAVLLTAEGGNERFHTSKEALESVFNALVTGMIIARDQDVLPALGTGRDKAKATRFPFSRSGNSVVYLSGEMRGVQEALASLDLMDLTPNDFTWIYNAVDFEFDNAIGLLETLEPPLRQSFEEGDAYDKVAVLAITLKSLRDTIALELAGALNLAGGFNALDGD